MNLRCFQLPQWGPGMLLCALLCAFAAGCGRNAQMRSFIDMLGTEHRLLEDDFYALDSEYKYTLEEARRLQRENESLRKRLGLAPTDPVATSPAETVPAGEGFADPMIELGNPEPPAAIPDAPKQIPNGSPPAEALPGSPAGSKSADDDDAAYVPPDDVRVTHIVINPVLTSGHDFDRRPGDDGVSVVIEPRNADDVFVPRAGNVSIVALDPAQTGQAQRVARWEFDIEESLLRLRTSRFGRGLNFKLPWTGVRPENSKLHLFVRYISDDGRVLEDDREIVVTREGEYSNRWTPKTVRPAVDIPGADGAAAQQILIGNESRDSGDGTRSVLAKPLKLPAPSGARSPPEEISPPGRPVWQPNRPK